ncbi:hypothetical protein ACLD9R_16855 [Serratia marcescens]|uniref:MrpH family fimbial adhesin n=1 Tax=Serratia marcescens TaxID=615 RepID=UPI00396C4712
MRFLMRLLPVFIFLGWSGYSYSYDVEIDWQLSSDGYEMRYTILSVNSRLTDVSKVNCGLLASCYVFMRGDNVAYSRSFPKMSSFRGMHTVKSVADAWGRTSPSGVITNWSKLVEKANGRPCFAFDMRGSTGGGSFGDTCGGSATPPPVTPKPPEPQVSCYLSGNIYLQHGSLADSEVAANKANTTARVYCTGAAKVKVRALSSIGSDSYMVNLRSDGSLQSLLTVNGVVGNGNGVLLDVPGLSGKDVVFSSMLITSGTPAPGDFSGSAVAVVDIL